MGVQDEHFQKGDWLVHAHYGVGQVKGKEKKTLEGEQQAFLKVKTLNGVYWLPVERVDSDHIRPLASRYQIGRALRLLRRAPKRLPQDHKSRRKEISRVLLDVSLYDKARMMRDLYGRRIRKKWNFSEGDAFEKMKQSFLDEWCLVKDEDREALEMKLMKALETGAEKMVLEQEQ